jgi:hypothetical protein
MGRWIPDLEVIMIPMRLQTVDGEMKYRTVPDVEHSAICRAFNLDPVRTRIEWPRGHLPGLTQEGVVYFSGQPIARLFVAREGDTFRDVDPTSTQDFWRERPVR